MAAPALSRPPQPWQQCRRSASRGSFISRKPEEAMNIRCLLERSSCVSRGSSLSKCTPAALATKRSSDVPASATRDPLSGKLSSFVAGKMIQRIHIADLTPLEFDEAYRSTGRPVIITGAIGDSSKYSLSAFADLLGSFPLTCRIHGTDGYATKPHLWSSSSSHARQTVPTDGLKFKRAIETGVASQQDCYVQSDICGSGAGQVIAPLLAAIGDACGLESHPILGPVINAWWGSSGHTEPLHMDVTDGTLCQLHGSKRVVLFPPFVWRDLAPFPVNPSGMSWAFSQIALSRPDFARFPQFEIAWAHRMEAVLHEGDVLFIPAGAAHEITGDGDDHVLSVNRFWKTDVARVAAHLPPDARAAFAEGFVSSAGRGWCSDGR